ncbi:MAG: hypothetical protein EOO63_05025 [Hymenobacter sp.]|nr:MAG: hypothetical protein EOO63_05025 [Hymenobacter sp.]
MLKLWVGGIIEANLADSFRQLRNALEQTVNTALQAQHYGDALLAWDVVIAVRLSPPPEHARYNAQTKETDICVVIDYTNFEQASSDERAGQLADAVLKSLHYLRTKSIPGLDFEQLQQDVSVVLAKG